MYSVICVIQYELQAVAECLCTLPHHTQSNTTDTPVNDSQTVCVLLCQAGAEVHTG